MNTKEKETLNKETIQVIKDAKNGININGPFESVEELKAALKK